MKSGHASIADETTAYASDFEGERRYVRGLSDEIGDRVFILDESRNPTSELLRFRRTLTTSPGFEVALRRRVHGLRHFHHSAFAETPAVECLGRDRRLGLLSNYTPGRRLSDLLAHAQDPVLAASLIHQLIPALDALNEYGEGVGHCALTASRIVCAPDGQLIIIEHVLGSAVQRFHLTPAASRQDLGIPTPVTDTGYPPAHGAIDCFQLALVAVSMLLGRSLREGEYSDLAGTLNAAFAVSDQQSVETISGLRVWLERALQLERGFLTLRDARAALREVAVPDPAAVTLRWRALQESSGGTLGDQPALNATLWDAFPVEESADVLPGAAVAAQPVEPAAVPIAEDPQPEAPAFFAGIPFLSKAYFRSHSATDYIRWALIALALCAIVEAAVIARLLAGRGSVRPAATVAQVNLVTNDPGAPVMVDGRVAGVTPLDLSINSEVRSIKVGSALTLGSTQEGIVGSSGQETNPLPLGPEPLAADPRSRTVPALRSSGGIRVSSPIELDVFEGEKRLGSTATGIVPAQAGRHEVDLINSVLGFRSRHVVDVRAGQVVRLAVSPPAGRININAVPWAEVLIDGKSIGETPIGNFSIPLGEHEIVFRHPQLGEVRRTAVVRSDAVTRISANLER